MTSSRRLSTYGVAAALAVGSLWLLLHSLSLGRDYSEQGYSYPSSHPNLSADSSSSSTSDSHAHTLRRRNVTFASSFVYHGDVYMALAKTMGDIMDSEDADGQIHVFAQPFPYSFQEVVDDLHLWTHQGVRGPQEDFIDFLNSETGEGGVDLVVLGTCQFECVAVSCSPAHRALSDFDCCAISLPFWYHDLKDAWERRHPDHKFKIVCYVHNVKELDWERWIPWWAQRNAIRLMAIGDQ